MMILTCVAFCAAIAVEVALRPTHVLGDTLVSFCASPTRASASLAEILSTAQ